MSKNIVIVGGGPGGLTLARILQLNGVQVKLYEKEISIDARSQGGTLDLHAESGQHALKTAQLFDKFQALCRPEGQDMRIFDKSGKVLMEEVSQENDYGRPEIDRHDLKQILYDSLKTNTVIHGHCLKNVEPLQDGRYKLIFDNGVTDIADLLIGADGAWSRIRPLVSSAKTYYPGVTMVEVQFSEVDDRHPEITKLIGRGTAFALSENKGLIAQRNGHNRIRVYITLRLPENWIVESGIDFNQPEQARAYFLQMFSDWDDKLRDLIRLCDDQFIARMLHVLPTDHSWETRPGVTLLGDAAHVMSPFAGEGVNLAMLDATELALAIVGCGDGDLTKAIHDFEQQMFARAATAASESASNLDLFISPGNSAEKVVELFKVLMANGPPPTNDSKL